jgi:hypothetical protein
MYIYIYVYHIYIALCVHDDVIDIPQPPGALHGPCIFWLLTWWNNIKQVYHCLLYSIKMDTFGSCSSTFFLSCHILSISLRQSPWSPSHSGATPFTMYRVSTEWFVQPAIWYWCTVPSTLNNSTCIRAYHLGTSMHTNISPTSTQSRPFSLNTKRLSRNHSWVLDVFTLVSDTGAII